MVKSLAARFRKIDAARAKTTKFVILARYRSGSNLLNESLSLLPGVKVLGEIFNLANIANNPRLYLDPDFVAKIFSVQREDVTRAVGFKLMYGQTAREELAESHWGPNVPPSIRERIGLVNAWLAAEHRSPHAFEHLLEQVARDREIRIIHLVRSNQLESYVSFQLALREDNWIGAAYKTSRSGLHVDKDDLERYFLQGEACSRYYADLFRQHQMLEITYQDLSSDFAATLRKVLEALDLVVAGNLTPPLSKQNTRKMSDLITNFDELRRYFKDTRWGGYF